jgi:hypothetical protein
MGGAFGHASAAAGAAEPAFLAGEGYEFLVFAVFALEPQESVGQDTTLEKCLELFGDMFWDPLFAQLGDGFERSVIAGDGLVKHSLLRPAWLVISLQSLKAELMA